MTVETFRPLFVEEIPEHLDDGVLYISLLYSVTVHRCASGCGRETVNPLSPAQWNITYNGVDISLSPSVGNWNYPCSAHYWIRYGRVEWAPQWTREQIEAGHANDQRAVDSLHAPEPVALTPRRPGLLRRLLSRKR